MRANSNSNNNTNNNGSQHPPLPPSLRLDAQSQDYIKSLCSQLRNPDFRERINAIEKFQIVCEREANLAIANIVPVRFSNFLWSILRISCFKLLLFE
jgi:hypothetical protein